MLRRALRVAVAHDWKRRRNPLIRLDSELTMAPLRGPVPALGAILISDA